MLGDLLAFEGKDNDFRDWDAWECSFFGNIPSPTSDSEGSLVLPVDVQLKSISWKFPEMLGDKWSIICMVDDEPVFEANPSSEPIGKTQLSEPNSKLFVLKGSVLLTKVVYDGESDEIPPYFFDTVEKHGYSIFIKGYSLREKRPQTLTEYLFEDPPEVTDYSDWQEENS